MLGGEYGTVRVLLAGRTSTSSSKKPNLDHVETALLVNDRHNYICCSTPNRPMKELCRPVGCTPCERAVKRQATVNSIF